MTALCGGASSGPKPGAALVVDYSTGVLAELLEEASAGWLTPVLPFLSLIPLSLNVFCASDPPPVPVFTVAEADAIRQLTLGPDFDSGITKALDWCQNMIWNDACQCLGGVYTPPVAPVQPNGSITIIEARGPNVPPCNSVDWPGSVAATGNINCADSNDFWFTDNSNATVGTHTIISVPNGPPVIQFVTVPTGGTFLNLDTRSSACGTFFRGAEAVPATATGVNITNHVFYDSAANLTQRTVHLDWFCNGDLPTTPLQPCCPPDTATQATLEHILDLVLSMQRNYAPFAYTKGNTHAGLANSGSIAISRLIGVQVTITAVPPTSSSMPGNPLYIRDLGWISASEVDGMIEERRVSQQQFTWFPRLMPLADHLNYALTAGTTATIVELLAEP